MNAEEFSLENFNRLTGVHILQTKYLWKEVGIENVSKEVKSYKRQVSLHQWGGKKNSNTE
jgi:hypothetical protein